MTATQTTAEISTVTDEIREARLVTINAAADWYAEGHRSGAMQGCGVTEREMAALRIIIDELAKL